MAITVAEGSYVAKCGVERLSRACGEGEESDHSRTVLSREQERKVSLEGQTVREVTGAV